LLSCGQKWLASLTPFFKESVRKQAGCQHRLFFSQVEYCDNLIFHRRAAVDQLGQRLLDANRTIGQPNKLFERIYSPLTAGLLQPYRPDTKLDPQKRTQLDRLYQKVVDDLEKLFCAVGLNAA
jgi:hypothetical protein